MTVPGDVNVNVIEWLGADLNLEELKLTRCLGWKLDNNGCER
jgi:hypothetical protein